VKHLLLAAALIAVGIACLSIILSIPRSGPFEWYYVYEVPLIWFGGGALIGAGLLTPFKKVAIGAVIGIGVQIVLVLCLYAFTDLFVRY
jgi:hypothetical protein